MENQLLSQQFCLSADQELELTEHFRFRPRNEQGLERDWTHQQGDASRLLLEQIEPDPKYRLDYLSYTKRCSQNGAIRESLWFTFYDGGSGIIFDSEESNRQCEAGKLKQRLRKMNPLLIQFWIQSLPNRVRRFFNLALNYDDSKPS